MKDAIRQHLLELKDEKYRLFQAKLMPGTDPERIIGVRTPELRKYAKQLIREGDTEGFLKDLPHKYYDEDNLHGFIISEIKDYERAVEEIDRILPYIDNWATCDLLSPKAFKRNRDKLPGDIERWLSSEHTYTIRFGIEMVMSHYLDDDYDRKWLERISTIKSEEYYVNMMLAWFYATALAKQWEDTVAYIENGVFDKWVHNKTIQKAVESYRITSEQKEYLKGLRRKGSEPNRI